MKGEDLEVVQTEMNREMGHAQHPVQEDAVPAIAVREPGAGQLESGADIDPAEGQGLSQRVSRLEAEVRTLREIVKQERKLLRKAVLLQLGLEAYDELD